MLLGLRAWRMAFANLFLLRRARWKKVERKTLQVQSRRCQSRWVLCVVLRVGNRPHRMGLHLAHLMVFVDTAATLGCCEGVWISLVGMKQPRVVGGEVA